MPRIPTAQPPNLFSRRTLLARLVTMGPVAAALTGCGEFREHRRQEALGIPKTSPVSRAKMEEMAKLPIGNNTNRRSIMRELSRSEISAGDIRDVLRLMEDSDAFLPHLKLIHTQKDQAGQIMSILAERGMNNTFVGSSFTPKGETDRYAELIKRNLYRLQIRDREQMVTEYRHFGFQNSSDLEAIGNAMSEREVVFGMHTTGGLRRFWEQWGPDVEGPILATLDDTHWQALRELVEKAKPQAGKAISDCDHLLVKIIDNKVKSGTMSSWNDVAISTFQKGLAAKAGYEAPDTPPTIKLEPPEPYSPENSPGTPATPSRKGRSRFATFATPAP